MIGTGLIATPIAKVSTSLIPCPIAPLLSGRWVRTPHNLTRLYPFTVLPN